jgi:type III secretion protein V
MIDKLQQRFTAIKGEVEAGNLAAVITRSSDLVLVVAMAAMVGMMIVPLPTWLLDLLLTINITAAVTVLMVSMYISEATQIASYPTLLLITTLYRLSLDISATRLILLQADAGDVIRSFGDFVVQGNFVVGAIIFLIITLVQFIVITKGAERVAEVAARFTLDAMPGKQMSIDADLRAGIIDFHQARSRRESLARESQFYGAMDGAMKFVKGDAIAGIVITLINIVGGLVIGVVMNGMPAREAVETYSILTIGNGLVSQIPALLISISAGMVVTRVAAETADSNLGREVATQILRQPKAIAIAAGLLTILGLIPGLPKIPFFLLALLTGSIAYGLFRGRDMKAAEEAGKKTTAASSTAPEFTVTLPLVLQVSADLTPHIDLATDEGRTFYDTLAKLRTTLYYETGVLFPAIQVNGGNPFTAGAYQIWLNEVPSASGQIRTDMVLVDSPAKNIAVFGLEGEETRNPASGRPATWVRKDFGERAQAIGLKVWDTHEVLLLHLGHFLRKNARDFLGVQEVQWMTARLKEYYPALVDEVVPKPISFQLLTEVLQRLVDERVSVRDLKSIFQSLAEVGRTISDPLDLVEYVRSGLKRKICYQLSEGKPTLFVYQIDPEVDELFRNSIRHSPMGPQLEMDSGMIRQIVTATRQQIGDLPPTAQRPVIPTDREIRRFVKKLLEFDFTDLSVLSYDQLTPHIKVQPLASIVLPRTSRVEGAA